MLRFIMGKQMKLTPYLESKPKLGGECSQNQNLKPATELSAHPPDSSWSFAVTHQLQEITDWLLLSQTVCYILLC